jgi:hypothetical protein
MMADLFIWYPLDSPNFRFTESRFAEYLIPESHFTDYSTVSPNLVSPKSTSQNPLS